MYLRIGAGRSPEQLLHVGMLDWRLYGDVIHIERGEMAVAHLPDRIRGGIEIVEQPKYAE